MLPPVSSLSNDEFMHRASLAAMVINAALVRAHLSDIPVGTYEDRDENGNLVTKYYTSDFTQPRNLFFIDRHFMKKAKEILVEGNKRGQATAIRQIFGAQALYAVQEGSVSLSFDELTPVVFAKPKEPKETAKILQFPVRHHGLGS